MVQTMESPPFDLQAYHPPISLWEIVKQHVPVHEREEIKNMLGESLIDQSLELHEEVNTLLEIWRDYRDETTKVKPNPVLPEPPGLRDRLIQEIQFFVGSVKEKAKHEGVNADKILSRHNSEIIDYALDTFRPDSARPSSRLTARGNDGRETPMICSPSCSDRTSEASMLSEEVESMNEKLNILKFDEVVSHLRSTLEEEIETLLKDITFLQNCLDEEATFRAESTGTLTREPTLQELKEERSTLEKDLLSSMRSQTSPPVKPAFNPDFSKKALGPTFSGMTKVKSSANHGAVNSVSPMKPGPMKAFTSPVPPSGEKTVSSMKTNSGARVKERVRTSPMGDNLGEVRPGNQSGSNHRPGSPHSGRRRPVINSASKGSRLNGDISDSSQSVGYSVTKETSIKTSSREPGKAGPHLEAVLTLSKGTSGDATDVHHFVPSPPSSKPSTPRPSSAQRFRNMVLECRDSS
ncbi:Coiled-coil domain-containing protein [Mactra antiquata]